MRRIISSFQQDDRFLVIPLPVVRNIIEGARNKDRTYKHYKDKAAALHEKPFSNPAAKKSGGIVMPDQGQQTSQGKLPFKDRQAQYKAGGTKDQGK